MVALALTLMLQTAPAECPANYLHQPPLCVADVQIGEPLTQQLQYAGSGVERWRPWINIYFQASDVERALRVMRCESLGDPWARNTSSGAAGLMQHLPRYWAERSAQYGWAGWSIFSVDANIAIASHLVYDSPGGWGHFVCR